MNAEPTDPRAVEADEDGAIHRRTGGAQDATHLEGGILVSGEVRRAQAMGQGERRVQRESQGSGHLGAEYGTEGVCHPSAFGQSQVAVIAVAVVR